MLLLDKKTKNQVECNITSKDFLGNWGDVDLDKVKEFLNELEIPQGFSNIKVSFMEINGDSCDKSGLSIIINGKRQETDEEFQERLHLENYYDKEDKRKDLQRLEELAKRCDATITFKEE